MNKQDAINSEWLQTYESSVGKITQLVQPRHITPGLRKPYEYVLPIAEIGSLEKALRKLARIEKPLCQCALVSTSCLTYGRHIDVFFLSHPDSWSSMTGSGHTKLQWLSLAEALRSTLTMAGLGDAKPYVHDWASDNKFQIRFDVYIAAKELMA